MDLRTARESALSEKDCILGDHLNTNGKYFTKNSGRASTRSRKADERMVVRDQLGDLTQEISAAKANIKTGGAEERAQGGDWCSRSEGRSRR
jgi:hypothetical protein